jgi:glycine cleavage system H protein
MEDDEYMGKWKAVRIKQQLVDDVKKEVEKSEYKSLSEFVSEAIQNRLQELAKQRVTEYLERYKAARVPQLQPHLLYTPKHMWARMTAGGNVEIGVTEYFQKQLKEIVNIRTDGVGKDVSKDEPFGVAESWWFTYDLFSPLDGKIIAVNEKVAEDSFSLNAEPLTWIVRVQPLDTKTWINDMLSLQKYHTLVASS